ncbi:MAG: type II toxin-antitoxin system VapC family toxin [bacterium]
MILVDAGPLVALLHRDDQDHTRCVAALKSVRTALATTWAPVTEAMYLLSFSPRAQGGLLDMVERGALGILPLDHTDMPGVRVLMEKYRDRPMDFADATLVHAGHREGIYDVFTLDREHFSTYRIGRRGFTMIP